MKKNTILVIAALILGVAFIFVTGGLSGSSTSAQKLDDPKMPDVVTLGKDAPNGQITFNHVKHNGGTYTMDKGPIACTTCHHTARPKAELVKPLTTSWPADRTTTLTADLFTKDPKGAGVAACRDCHARKDQVPKLLPAIPTVIREGATTPTTMTNLQAFHLNCTGCHKQVKEKNPATTAPGPMQCALCHKKAA